MSGGGADWSVPESELFARHGSQPGGLTSLEASERRVVGGSPLTMRANTDVELLVRQLRNPVVLLLAAAAVLSMVLSDLVEASIIVAILVLSGVLGFWQERGATRAVAALAASVEVRAEALRDGVPVSVAVDGIVPGDVVILNAGDVVPADGRVLAANRLQVNESILTGENFPRRKQPGIVEPGVPLPDRSNFVVMGTHVASGQGRMLVTSTGASTELGLVMGRIRRVHLPTSFERGISTYGFMLAVVAGALVSVVLVVNLVLGRGGLDSVLFSLALAVGMTPQMLPAIVTLSMSRGARMLAGRRVIVKRLDAIEDIGAVDVVCTDKTGTLTEGAVTLVGVHDPAGGRSDEVLRLVHWNAHLQRGFDNPIDAAVIAAVGHSEATPSCLAEIPFDFDRRMVSVVVADGDASLLVAKGSVVEVLDRCASGTDRVGAMRTAEMLGARGERVLAVAVRRWPPGAPPESWVESGLALVGFVRFADPVKATAPGAVERLSGLGVQVKMITGDSRIAARHTATEVGMGAEKVMVGADVAAMSDDDLARAVAVHGVFAEVDPIQKERIVRALSTGGRNVAYLGDGINDVAALHAADVGVSVDGATDAARQVADLVLLDKDLGVLADGIETGRRVFLNTLKYVNVTTSANFGNMLSLAVATAFSPSLPLLPLQILLLNFLSDVPAMTIATDAVDPEATVRPVGWGAGRLVRFMVVFGLVSTAADLVCLAGLGWWFGVPMAGVRTGWFIESCLTEIVVMLSLRTRRPMWRSRPGGGLMAATAGVATLCLALPWLPVRGSLGFAFLGFREWVLLVSLTLAYLAATEGLKKRTGALLPGESRVSTDVESGGH